MRRRPRFVCEVAEMRKPEAIFPGSKNGRSSPRPKDPDNATAPGIDNALSATAGFRAGFPTFAYLPEPIGVEVPLGIIRVWHLRRTE